MLRVELGLSGQHGAGDRQQAVGDGAQCPGMPMSALSKFLVFFLAGWVFLPREPV